MALITCGECSTRVSDKAPACVGCGAPLRAGRGKTVTIQATGKDAKLLKIVSTIVIVVSFFMIFADSVPNHTDIAVWGFIIGVLGRIAARAMAWWKYR